MKDLDKFLKAAKAGIVTVEFERVDTKETRIMPCTLNSAICNVLSPLKIPGAVTNQSPKSEYICVWAIDRAAWRDFKVDTVKKWYIGYTEDEEGKN